MARWRWLLVVVILSGLIAFPPGGIDHTPAQTASDWFKVIAASGTPGTFNASTRTGECRYTAPGGIWQTEVRIPGPSATAIAGRPNQRVTWEPRLYQALVSGYQLLLSGPVQSVSLSSGSTNMLNHTLTGLPHGPAYFTGGRLTWFSNDMEIGAVEINYLRHNVFRSSSQPSGTGLTTCTTVAPPQVSLSTYRTTVNVAVHLTGHYFPISVPVSVTWKGTVIGQAVSDANGNVFATIKVPAAPAGDYQLGFDAGPFWKAHQILTLAPRVKLIPDQAERGELVKISLRGFAKKEAVRIRWLVNGTWVEVGWVNTSNTGSGELWIPVPDWVESGPNSVRGDGPSARAQTNAVTILGEPAVTLAEEDASPTPESVVPATPEPIADAPPATPAPDQPPGDATPRPEEEGPGEPPQAPSEPETPSESP